MQAAYLAEQTSTALPGWAPPALVGSAITACVTLIVWYLNSRRDPVKRITWEARTQSSIVSIDREFQQKVGVSYDGRNVSDLCAVRFKLKNTGNKVIKNHKIRLNFPGDSEILESHFSPDPERELGVSLLEQGNEEGVFTELNCLIAHFEADQEVSFEILAAGNAAKDWKVHSHNEEGDVQFREKSVERTTNNLQLVTAFLALILALSTIPSILSGFEELDAWVGVAAQLAILTPTLLLLPAATRALVKELGEDRSADSAIIHVNAEGGSVIYNARSASVGTARIVPSAREAE
ncbi:hypothetical protein [Streptomyces sp. NPDC057545]|uniref:hypothetical protein n=1 Tax=Streptomyces sp. NPDC057545 TaxID=3346164 RepID=UPI003685323D